MEDEEDKQLSYKAHSSSSKEIINTDSKGTCVTKVVSFMVSPMRSKKNSNISNSDEVMKLNYISEDLTSNASHTVTKSTGTERSMSETNCVENIQDVEEEQLADKSLDEYQQGVSDGEIRNTSGEYSIQISNNSYVPECVPPWAISVRKKYGMSLSSIADNYETTESKQNIREKIENLIKKHSDLMLVKRIESRKQFILEPNESFGQMDAIKMRAKNTRYYMAPLIKGDEKQIIGESSLKDLECNKKASLELPNLNTKIDSTSRPIEKWSLASVITDDKDSMSITKKTSKSKAKKEMSNVIKTLKATTKKSDEDKQNHTLRKEQPKCPKITLSKIREFVNAQAMDPKERKLQEIIKIEKVPTLNAQDKSKPGSKYTIIVPKEKSPDIGGLNVIKIKEKRKLRLQSIEDIKEKVTELHYSQGDPRRQRKHGELGLQQSLDIEDERITKRIKTPVEIKTFEVTSKRTPRIAPLVEEEEKTDKVLLIQYDKKTKQGKSKTKDECAPVHTTQLLGIKQPMNYTGEMYLYGAETDGSRVKENVSKVEDIPPTLKDKVHAIFEELKERAFKREAQLELTTSEMQATPAMSTQSTQRPQAMTEEVMVQAMPDVRSAEVQVHVRSSQLMVQPEIEFPKTPPSSFISGQPSIKRVLSTVDQTLEEMISDTAGMDTSHKYIEAEKEERSEEKLIKDELKSNDDILKETMAIEDDVLEEEVYQEDILITDVEEIGQLEKTDKEEFEAEAPSNTVDSDEIKTKGVTFGKKTSYEEDIVTITFSEVESKTDLTETKPEVKDQQSDQIFTEPVVAVADSLLSKSISKEPSIEKSYKKSDITMEPHDRLSDPKRSFDLSYRGVEQSAVFKSEIEDIRSYELDPHQGTELRIKSSSKFLHNKESIRKTMNWTEDTIYLEKHMCPKLIRALAETAMRRPTDPISFLAHWIYKDYHNREREERQEVEREHLELTRTMMEVGAQRHQEVKKFNIRRYPIQEIVNNFEDKLEEEPAKEISPETESAQNEVQEL